MVCAACGATRLKVLRQGVTRVREELEALLGRPVGEVAGPTAVGSREAPVVVGTEAVLHRVRRAAAVAFLDFDQHLLAPRFRPPRRRWPCWPGPAGWWAGGGSRAPAPVLVQTRLPDHEVLAAAVAGDPGCWLDETALRRELDLPPFCRLGRGLGSGGRRVRCDRWGGVADLGDDRWLVRAPDHRRLCDALAAAPRPAGRLRVHRRSDRRRRPRHRMAACSPSASTATRC